MQGESPVGIFGPGGHTLLFARFSQAGGGAARGRKGQSASACRARQDSKERQWLEL